MTNHNAQSAPSMFTALARRSLLLAAVLLAGAGVTTACEDPEPGEQTPAEEVEDAEIDERSASSCFCDYAYWQCPTDNATFEYWAPSCPGEDYTQARNQCEAHCPATCVNMGWHSDC